MGFGYTIAAAANCVRPAAQPLPLTVEERQAYEVRASAVFSSAVFHKPRLTGNAFDGLPEALAPLLVHEVRSLGISAANLDAGQGRDEAPFGQWVRDVERDGFVDRSLPTVYVRPSQVVWAGQERAQWVFVWLYPRNAIGRQDRIPAWRGVRLTMDKEGYPVIVEVLGSETLVRVMFVATSLELTAREAFGVPLPGRRFSIERSLPEAPQAMVLRTIEDGPIPMGPYVYVLAEPRDVSTVLCRCSPAQVGEMVSTAYYELRPMSELEGANPLLVAQILEASRASLEAVLRIPGE